MIPFRTLICFLAAGTADLPALRAQEEADRPVGEATGKMVQQRGADARMLVLPSPQEIHAGSRQLRLGTRTSFGFGIDLAGETQRLLLLPIELRKRVAARIGSAPAADGAVRVVFALSARDLGDTSGRLARQLATLRDPEGYIINIAPKAGDDRILVLGNSEAALWRALPTLAQLFEVRGADVAITEAEIVDYPQMQERGLLIDVGGQGFMVSSSRWGFDRWKQFVDWMVDHKFNALWIEFIGSGRLMGNLDPAAGEWIGFPLALKSYPQTVCRDRPIRRWDAAKQQVVADKYTAPNVEKEFCRELIDYAQARGIKCHLLIGYDYFANQLPFVLGVPANDPSHRGANKVYDDILREIVQRYDNASGVCFITIENKNVPTTMIDDVTRRMHEGRAIVKAINPRMTVGVLNDFLEWRPREETERFAANVPSDLFQLYSPHSQPQNKSWKRMYGDLVRYELYSQYAWNHIAYVFPERIKREVQEAYINGYRRVITQAWYADVFLLNYAVLAEMSWNSTGAPLDRFWDETLTRTFGAAALPHLRTALAHTRFDVRSDIVSRMLLNDHIDRPFKFWDMYTLTNIDGLKDPMLATLETDARSSLAAAQAAAPHIKGEEAREMFDSVLHSAERRLYLATSGRHFLRAHALEKSGDKAGALAAMELCLAEATKLDRAATTLGIEYPMATHDDDVLALFRRVHARLRGR